MNPEKRFEKLIVFFCVVTAALFGALTSTGGSSAKLVRSAPTGSLVVAVPQTAMVVATRPPIATPVNIVTPGLPVPAPHSAATFSTQTATPQPSPAATVEPTATVPRRTPTPPSVTPSATVAPTNTVLERTPTAASNAAQVLLRQVAQAEAALHSGQLEATIHYSDDTRSTAQVRFDLRSDLATEAFRIHMITTYQSAAGTETSEYLAIGNQAWQRQPGSPWAQAPIQEGAWGQLQAFLPHAASAPPAELTRRGETTELRWHDPNRATDVTLLVASNTGVPLTMHRHSGSEPALTWTVTYSDWNVPVEILPPIPFR